MVGATLRCMTDMAADVRRNTFVLAAAMALNWSVIVLLASLTALTIGHLFGLPELAGAGFGLMLLAYAAGSLLFGRAIDVWGRRNGLLAAFLVGSAAAVVIYVGVAAVSLPLALAGLLAIGVGTGGANLARVAGADMHPPERRARGISLVLVGAAFGAIGAPIVFAPVLGGAPAHDPAALAAPWLIAAGLLGLGAVVLLAIRVDPRTIAERLGLPAATVTQPAAVEPPRSIGALMRQPMVPLALLAAVVSQAVMTSVMALAGLVMADHGHDLGAISLTVSVHFLGMFGLVLVVGPLVERIGRLRSVVAGLVVLAGGVLVLLPGPELVNFMPGMFAVGVGWNIAFVASTTILADAARPTERGRLLGFSDFVALCAAAVLSVVAGLILGLVGLPMLVLVSVLLALVPALLIGLNRSRLEGLPAARG
jgi:MFS family permease